MTKFRKKPVVIEAFQITKERRASNVDWPAWMHRAWQLDRETPGSLWPTEEGAGDGTLSIGTLEGELLVSWGDWIIQGVKGELYPCKPEIFAATYDAIPPTPGTEQSPSAQADQRIEAELVAAGLNAPRITADHIQALMDRVVYHYENPQGTTSTFAHAYLDGFYLASGYSARVSAANFDVAKGQKYAKEQAEPKARDKLWELEGYALHKRLHAAS